MELLTLEQIAHSANARDGIPQAAETALRKEALVFVLDLAMRLRVSQYAVATAQILLQHFTVFRSFRAVDRLRSATACFFLSCKANEQIRSLSDVSSAFFEVERSRRLKKNPHAQLPEVTRAMHEKLTDDIVVLEGEVLRMIDFDVGRIELPYPIIKSIIRELAIDRENAETVHKVAWNFANDSLRSQAYLLHPVSAVARVCVFLACEYVGVATRPEVDWDCVERVIQVYNDSLPKEP